MQSWLYLLKNNKQYVENIKGYTYIFLEHNKVEGFISDTDDFESKVSNKILLTESIIDKIIKQDKTFGVLVGGNFLYYAMPTFMTTCHLIYKNNSVFLGENGVLTLFENELEQIILI